jgi:GntR family transcriptional regulator, colanic acid and biofilm gene transcriptional regulator
MPKRDIMRDHESRPIPRPPPEAAPPVSPLLEEQVYRTLREALIRGDFAPGEPLSIRRIAAALQISPMPVRTCLRRLAAEQCLDMSPGGTAVVPQLRRAEFAEITALRAALEPMAAGLAASAITEDELAEAASIALHGGEQRRHGDEGGYQLANYQFHFAIYRAARSPLLLSMIETLWVRRSPIMRESQQHLHARHADLHDELLAALRAHDTEHAAGVLCEDIERAGRFLIDRLRFHDEAERTTGIATLKPLARTTRPGRKG